MSGSFSLAMIHLAISRLASIWASRAGVLWLETSMIAVSAPSTPAEAAPDADSVAAVRLSRHPASASPIIELPSETASASPKLALEIGEFDVVAAEARVDISSRIGVRAEPASPSLLLLLPSKYGRASSRASVFSGSFGYPRIGEHATASNDT